MLPSCIGLQSLSKMFLPELFFISTSTLYWNEKTYMAGWNLIVILLLFFAIKNLA
jgi:hypothetical protein